MWWSVFASADTFMPPAVSSIGRQYDSLYGFLLIASLISCLLLIGGMIYFVMKYKRRTGSDKTAYITHNHLLEFLWSFIPFTVFMIVFVWGWVLYHDMRTFPADSLEVHVIAKKWDWRFVYKSGKEAVGGLDANNNPVPATLVVPINRPVKLIMSSEKVNPQDPLDRAVLHSFYIPTLRVKQDVVPGRYTALGFTIEREGEYNVFCAEYCGTNHSGMRAIVKAVSQEDFEKWLASDGSAAGLSLAEKGKALFGSKACIGCHSLNGTRLVGPSFKGLFGKEEALESGTAKVDETYIRESLLEPNKAVVKGFVPSMPTYKGQLTDDDINALIEFIKSVK